MIFLRLQCIIVHIIFNLCDLHHRTSHTNFLSRFINRGIPCAASNILHSTNRRRLNARTETFETLCSRITSCYACVHRRRTDKCNCTVFYGLLCCIPDAHVRFSKVDADSFLLRELIIPWENRYITAWKYLAFLNQMIGIHDWSSSRDKTSRMTADKVRAFLLERRRNSSDVAIESKWILNITQCNFENDQLPWNLLLSSWILVTQEVVSSTGQNIKGCFNTWIKFN